MRAAASPSSEEAFATTRHTLDGGEGIDTAVFSAALNAYTIGQAGTSIVGPDGIDSLTNIERLAFWDKTLAFDLALREAAGNMVHILRAAFDGPTIDARPDRVRIGVDLFDADTSMLEACALVVEILELSDAAFVARVFTNVLEIAARHPLNEGNIDLVGLQANGVEFV